ncbi:MAG: acyl-CoA dehydrogenase family protein, partial [Pseudomonadales bacterium]
MDLATFRAETRAWIEANCPEGAKGPGPVPLGSTKVELPADTRLWLERMADKGWTVPTWPMEYGGAELDRPQYEVLVDELKRAGARTPLTGRGVNYIGPTILEFGKDE